MGQVHLIRLAKWCQINLPPLLDPFIGMVVNEPDPFVFDHNLIASARLQCFRRSMGSPTAPM